MRRPTTLRLTAVVLAVGLVTACGADDPAEVEETSASPGGTPTVSGGFGTAPTIELPDGAAGDELVVEVLAEGDGDAVAEDQLIVVDYQTMVWPADDETATSATEEAGPDRGEPLFDTFQTGTPEPLRVSEESLLKGMVKGLVGATVGSRVLLVLPPSEAFGKEGQAEMGVGPNDSLVFVFDVLDAFAGDEAAEGTVVELPPGGPTVAESETGPVVTMPATAPPTELVVQQLIEGDGPPVESGQVIVVHYRGVLWKDGSEFDATWSRNQPAGFLIGTGNVIPGWDKALVGQPVGTRVLITVPPAEGYGPEGNPPTIAGDDTLVFVVDILGAYGGAAEPSTPAPTETPAG